MDPAKVTSLSPRELQILRELAEGAPSNKEIATRQGISEQTVKNHLSRITKKLCVGNRITAAILYIAAGREGLIPSSS